ncbi:MAG: tRNA (adenosine(37)-N6)-dimethylallyltransferase MiaA [Oscillospiraceae bacterium]|jgi:tRNA dimethylallyltransferase|nr:tRNA (adenosine(37)-N6)-dimethylallyltransferase MiaA [Oscillospiraceae bacterium]
MGTTASGKSELGVQLAKRFGGEVISADSRQVYRGFDLCSGKITVREQDGVVHHLIDIRDVGDQFSVADFQAEAYRLIPEIAARGALAIIVGGTGLYVDSVLYGYEFTGGPPDRAARAELERMPDAELAALLDAAAPQRRAASDTYALNRRRMIRLIESARSGGHVGYTHAPRFDILPLGATWPKDVLGARIKARLAERIGAGMTGEVEEYLGAGGDPGVMRALGLEFKHICMYLSGEYASAHDMAQQLEIEIRRFAKRQSTWFRRNGAIVWLDMAHDPCGQAARETERFLAGAAPGQAMRSC